GRGGAHRRPHARGDREPWAADLRQSPQRPPLRALALGRQEGRRDGVPVGARSGLARAQEGMTAGFTIRRARPEDHPAVARELAEYLAYIGDRLDADGLDHDIAHWQAEDDGRSGVLLLVLDATAAVVRPAPLALPRP